MPAVAGMTVSGDVGQWIPACAGMTKMKDDLGSRDDRSMPAGQ